MATLSYTWWLYMIRWYESDFFYINTVPFESMLTVLVAAQILKTWFSNFRSVSDLNFETWELSFKFWVSRKKSFPNMQTWKGFWENDFFFNKRTIAICMWCTGIWHQPSTLPCRRCSYLMFCMLDSRTCDLHSSPGRGYCRLFFGKKYALKVHLFFQEYKWLPAILMLDV